MMGTKQASCLYCGETYEFVTSGHLKTHFGDTNAFEKYKDWVANEHDLDRSHDVFHTRGALTKPADFNENKHLFK